MPRKITIQFEPDVPLDQVRNFGEDLYRLFERTGRAAISLEEIDTATTMLTVVVHSTADLGWTVTAIKKVLRRALLAHRASVETRKG